MAASIDSSGETEITLRVMTSETCIVFTALTEKCTYALPPHKKYVEAASNVLRKINATSAIFDMLFYKACAG
jgi:hypothetical protein